MTSFTPKSAMTSFTDSLVVSVPLAAQGARTATGAVKATAGQSSSKPVVVLVNDYFVHPNAQLLSSHIDSRDHIFVNNFRRHHEPFAEDIEHRVAADETHQVVAATLGLRQRMFWRRGRFRMANLRAAQSHL